MSITGERMRERRKQLEISADTLADFLGVSRTTIFRYENGDIDKVPAKFLTGIATLLKTSEQFLMGWEDDPEALQSNNSSLILAYYELLNDAGKKEATKRVKELTFIPDYSTRQLNMETANDLFLDVASAKNYIKEHRAAAFDGIDKLEDAAIAEMANTIKNNTIE